MTVPMHSVADLASGREPAALALGSRSAPAVPLVFVDVGCEVRPVDAAAAARWAEAARTTIVVGVTHGVVAPGLEALVDASAFTLVPQGTDSSVRTAGVADVRSATAAVWSLVSNSPRAAVTLAGLIRVTGAVEVPDGLIVESLAYSMLLAGPEHASWRAGRGAQEAPRESDPAVLLSRNSGRLVVELNRPARHNAFDREIRDGLIDAFDLVDVDDSIEQVVLRGRGPSFCSGGDLAEFGSAVDTSIAHLVRLDRSVGLRIDRVRDRVVVELHGACIGAGIELASFARRVEADRSTYFQLPELTMGLIPGAGGTVSLTRRIGRWRTAYLALSAERLDVRRAHHWGMVDAVVDR